MPPFRTPEQGDAKFIHIDGLIWTTRADDLRTEHCVLAARDGIINKFEQAALRDSDSVYTGTFSVVGALIIVNRQKQRPTLQYKPTEEGYERAVRTFRRLGQGFEISEGA